MFIAELVISEDSIKQLTKAESWKVSELLREDPQTFKDIFHTAKNLASRLDLSLTRIVIDSDKCAKEVSSLGLIGKLDNQWVFQIHGSSKILIVVTEQ